MKRQKSQSLRAGNLRPQAERRLQEKGNSDADDLARTDLRAVVHELQAHQIELEMQNEELRRAQAQAEEAQQKYTELFDFAPMGYFLVDQDGLIREANLAGAALLGRDRSQVTRQPFAKFIAPDGGPQFAAFWSKLRETDTRQSCELTLLKQGQGLRPVVLEAAVLSGLAGGGMRFLLALTDITARKQAEEVLESAMHGLERHVEERTAELQRSNVRLAKETEEREQAEENLAEQLLIERLLADLSARFVDVPAGEVDREIMDAQRRLCEFLGLDMSALRQWLDEDPDTFTLTYFYSAQGVPQPPRKVKQEAYPWIVQQMRAGRIVALASLEDLPAEAARDRESARQLGVQSSLCLPLSVGGKPVGILALNTTRAKRDWPEELVKRMQLVAHILASALARKRADQALRASQERLILAADAAEAGAWELDCHTQGFWVTDKARVLFGYLPEVVVTMAHFKAAVHPDDWDLIQRSLDRSLQAGEPLNLECRIRLGNGGERWISSRGRPSFKPTGEPDRLLALSIDITERKRTEAALLASEARLSVGAELAGLGHHEVDYDKGTCFVDDRVQSSAVFPRATTSSLQPLQFFMDHLHPDDRQFFMDERQKMHDGKVEHLSLEYRYLHPTEGQKWIHHLTRIASRDASGRLLRTVGVLRDITARKQAEVELLRQRTELAHLSRVTMLGELSGSMAHELNQPLTAILSNAQAAQRFLADDHADPNELRDILADIVAEDKRAGEVIRRLRLLLKKGEVQHQPLSVNEVTLEVIKLVRSELVNQNFTVQTHLAPDLPIIHADGVQLQQVLLNLVMNACEAMADAQSRARKITLRTERCQDGSVHLSVADCGPGIPPEKLEQIFDSFYTTKPQGMGLGLAVCRSIITAHGGNLWATNNPARGATVHFTLPVSGKEQVGNMQVAGG